MISFIKEAVRKNNIELLRELEQEFLNVTCGLPSFIRRETIHVYNEFIKTRSKQPQERLLKLLQEVEYWSILDSLSRYTGKKIEILDEEFKELSKEKGVDKKEIAGGILKAYLTCR